MKKQYAKKVFCDVHLHMVTIILYVTFDILKLNGYHNCHKEHPTTEKAIFGLFGE